MQGRIKVVLRRHQRRRLKRWLRRTRDAQLSRRIQVVRLYVRRLGCDQVARALGVSAPTAARLARRFVEDGDEGLLDRRKQYGSPKVDADTLEAVRRLVRASPRDFGFARATWTRVLLAKSLYRIARVRVSPATIGRMLTQLGARRSYSTAQRIHLVLDNYGIHSSKRVQQLLADFAPKTELHFLPLYCPEEYRIERTWLDLHANVTRDHASPTIQHLMARVGRYLIARKDRRCRVTRQLDQTSGAIAHAAA